MSKSSSKRAGVPSAGPKPPPWFRPGWRGPKVEVRPEDAGPEWPEGATERVIFLPEDFPCSPAIAELPHTEYYGADGWPLNCPPAVKPKLDLRMQAELRRLPCMTIHWSPACWLGEATDYDTFERLNAQAGLIRGDLQHIGLPQP